MILPKDPEIALVELGESWKSVLATHIVQCLNDYAFSWWPSLTGTACGDVCGRQPCEGENGMRTKVPQAAAVTAPKSWSAKQEGLGSEMAPGTPVRQQKGSQGQGGGRFPHLHGSPRK